MTLSPRQEGKSMRDTVTVAGWVGGAMLISVSLMVLCQHAEGERTRAALRATQAHVDDKIHVLNARLTDVQADVNRKKLATALQPPLDPKRLVKASKELDQLINTPPPGAVRTATLPVTTSGAADSGQPPAAPPAAAAPAAAPAHLPAEASQLVRICPGGRYYHRPGCKRVQKATVSISRAVAEAGGRRPCPTCKP
jgi:hypothetical protein